MKKLLSFILMVVLLTNIVCIPFAAADTEYVEVTEDSAPIRDDYYDTGNVLQWVSRGSMLRVISSKRNMYLNKWYQVEYDTGRSCLRGWIYSGNVSEHKHNYQKYSYNGNTFGVCTKCRTVSMERVSTVQVSQANSLVAALPAAGGLAAADGPLPFGEIAGLVILGLAYLELGNTVTTTTISEWVNSVSLDDIVREENACSEESFYRVKRTSTGLVKKDNKCLTVVQAFLYSRFMNNDVWTMSPASALLCASLNVRFFGPERDSSDWQNKYYHYHYGLDHKNQDADTHVFFGSTEYGQTPGSY